MVITDGSATVTFNEAIKTFNICQFGVSLSEVITLQQPIREHVGKFTVSGLRKVKLNVKKMATGAWHPFSQSG